MNIELWITIGIALIGWTWAITQFFCNRKWQKKDMLATRRYDAYSIYMRKCEEISENMRKDPQIIFEIIKESYGKILKSKNQEETNVAIMELNQQLFDYIQRLSIPLTIISQEINSLLLIASTELTKKLEAQKNLIIDFNNEIQNCLDKINVRDEKSFQELKTIGHDNRWNNFTTLNNEIMILMRKEIGVK